jgi:arginyl-tRNA synthetase
MKATVENYLNEWLKEAFLRSGLAAPDMLTDVEVAPTPDERFGDYQCNAAMALAKMLKKPPRTVAEAVLKAAPAGEAVEKAEVAGPGFINIHLAPHWMGRALEEFESDDRLGVPDAGQGRTVVLDYGGPNITKPLHIGHLRSPNIGSAVDRMLRLLGYRVIADNHLGDWGTQFGITIMGYRHFGRREAMEQSPMEELERVYVASYEKAKADPEWMEQCRRELVKLQSGDPENLALWKEFVRHTLEELGRIYGRLGFRFDLTRGESYYNDRLPSVVEQLIAAGIARESEGAIVAFLDDEKLPPCIVRKRDGAFNYATTDIATILLRVEEFKPEAIVYFTDERQQLHFKQVFAIARRLGVRARLDHVWFGLMRLPTGTFSTREGNVVRLEKLLDEAEDRALAIVQKNNPDLAPDEQRGIARAVGVGAVKYADLSQNPQSVVTFTWEKALALEGNSAPYLQYACARVASVWGKYRERFPESDPMARPIRLEHPLERALAVRLLRYPDVVLKAAELYRPNLLADYLYDVAQAYSAFYQNVPFLKAEEGVRESRVRLCDVTARVLKTGLGLLGIETPERI